MPPRDPAYRRVEPPPREQRDRVLRGRDGDELDVEAGVFKIAAIRGDHRRRRREYGDVRDEQAPRS
jgi:hypothetical protein